MILWHSTAENRKIILKLLLVECSVRVQILTLDCLGLRVHESLLGKLFFVLEAGPHPY